MVEKSLSYLSHIPIEAKRLCWTWRILDVGKPFI